MNETLILWLLCRLAGEIIANEKELDELYTALDKLRAEKEPTD